MRIRIEGVVFVTNCVHEYNWRIEMVLDECNDGFVFQRDRIDPRCMVR